MTEDQDIATPHSSPAEEVAEENRAATNESEAQATEHSLRLLLKAESFFSGPLPPPSILARYDEIAPGTAERIVRMAEDQGTHRRYLERAELDSGIKAQTRGQYLAFIVAMVVSLGGIYLLATGHSVSGLVALLTPLAGLAGLFLVDRSRRKHRREPSEDRKFEQE